MPTDRTTNIVTTGDSTAVKTPAALPPTITAPSEPVLSVNQQQIQTDLTSMIQYASHRGISIPSTINLAEHNNDKILLENYNTMIKAIEPATVQSINYIHQHILEPNGEDKKWYYTPIISKCLLIAGAGPPSFN